MLYFDNAATSFPKAPQVAQAVFDFITKIGANAGRASYKNAVKSSEIIYDVRELLAEIFNISDEDRIILTSGNTEALNTVIFGFIKKGMTVLTSNMEHNSVMRPLNHLANNGTISLHKFDITNGVIDFKEKLDCNPDLVITLSASNVTGEIYQVEKLAELTKSKGAVFAVDAAQSAGVIPTDLGNSAIDVYCASGHKGLLGPMGVGFFYIKDGIELNTYKFGGTGSQSESEFQPKFLPDKFESGTGNISGLAGFKSALQYLIDKGIEHIWQEKQILSQYFIEKLYENRDVFACYSVLDTSKQTGVFSLIPQNKSITEFTRLLDENGVCVRMGYHCSPAAHKSIGSFDFGGTIRFSLHHEHTKTDIDKLFSIIDKIK